ncbi:MAG TPA: DUF3108 domain-containing protein [Chthoniobacterales bacterium]|nr:DUF3108 domain-containing protein [Chthoniobacterales bacterium]
MAVSSAVAAEWEASVSPVAIGSFPEPRALRAHYRFGWGGVTAATGDVRFGKTSDGRFRLDATGGTTGLARTLWAYDVKHTATSDARSLRPLRVAETEQVRSKTFTTDIAFTEEGVTSVREERGDGAAKSKTRRFTFPNVWSLNSSLLYLRTQPLRDRAVQRIVIYPATSAYLATVTVIGRDRITVPTGTYDAIKVDVQLKKIGKGRELQAHKKFRGATVWLSDDIDRLILRIETQVFIGTVFAELQSVEFENAKP